MKPDNLSKPICASEPSAAPDGIAEKDRPDSAVPGTEGPIAPLLDVKGALERLEGDRELFEDLARLFADECPKGISEIRSALDSVDFILLERLAHRLKGSSACVGAESVRQIALELEISARARDLPEAKKLVGPLQNEIDRLMPELKAIFGAVAR
jgi:HPt (histidine-containing phosphotransfer) domain-containing protein